MGALDYLSNFCTIHTRRRHKRKSMQTVEIKVKMDCDGCERKVRNAVTYMKGVKSVDVNRKQSKVTVTGYVEPHKVLHKIKNTGKRAEFWPYIPYNVVAYPHATQAYDKKAPAGYVKNAPQANTTNLGRFCGSQKSPQNRCKITSKSNLQWFCGGNFEHRIFDRCINICGGFAAVLRYNLRWFCSGLQNHAKPKENHRKITAICDDFAAVLQWFNTLILQYFCGGFSRVFFM
ncbi:unnamed protein product [Rhodiola kirilowii]